jgi:histidine ammonia-lyase
MVTLTGAQLSIAEVRRVAVDGEPVVIAETAHARIRESRAGA